MGFSIEIRFTIELLDFDLETSQGISALICKCADAVKSG